MLSTFSLLQRKIVLNKKRSLFMACHGKYPSLKVEIIPPFLFKQDLPFHFRCVFKFYCALSCFKTKFRRAQSFEYNYDFDKNVKEQMNGHYNRNLILETCNVLSINAKYVL